MVALRAPLLLLALGALAACGDAAPTVGGAPVGGGASRASPQASRSTPFAPVGAATASMTGTTTVSETRSTMTRATTIGDWRTYRNARAGYAIDHPASWIVDERVGTDGSAVTTFTPPDGGAGVAVIVFDGDAGATGEDLPNARCQPVTIGGLPGTRCFDTLNFALSTTLAGAGKTYVIATTGKRPDQFAYQRFLDSFRAGR